MRLSFCVPHLNPLGLGALCPKQFLALPAFLVLACAGVDSDALTMSSAPGSVRVSVFTLGSRLDPDGYVIGVDEGAPRSVPAAGAVTFSDLTPGDHTVELGEMAPNCSADENPRAVRVRASTTEQVAFEVVCSHLAYVTSSIAGTVSVLETGTHSVIATIPVDAAPQGVVITPDGSLGYVTHFARTTISVIETATNTVTAGVAGLNQPRGIALTPDGALAYVANSVVSGGVSVVATAANQVIDHVSVGNRRPHRVAITPEGAFVYVATSGPTIGIPVGGNLTVVETTGNTVVGTAGAGEEYLGVAVRPDGAFVYATLGNFAGAVEVISTATNTAVASVPVGQRPIGVAFTPDGTLAYVANQLSSTVSVLETVGHTVVATIALGARPGQVAITPDGRFAYLPSFSSGTLTVVEIATNLVVAAVPLDTGPVAVAFTRN